MEFSTIFKIIVLLVLLSPIIFLPCLCWKANSDAEYRRKRFEKQLAQEQIGL